MPSPKESTPNTAIILCGGRGTRLGALTDSTPKPLLPVAGRPFLCFVLDWLVQQGITRVVLATGYLSDSFRQSIGTSYKSLNVEYSTENTPLGTGGALRLAASFVMEGPVYVLNGDTYFPIELPKLAACYWANRAELAVALRTVPNTERYGAVATDGAFITAFSEKGSTGPGSINGGIYLIDATALRAKAPAGPFSLERELIPVLVDQQRVVFAHFETSFIDIGIPEDLARAGALVAPGAIDPRTQ